MGRFNGCAFVVKKSIVNSKIRTHRKCNLTKVCNVTVKGSKLNAFFDTQTEEKLENDTYYRVCSNVNDLLKKYTVPLPINVTNIQKVVISIAGEEKSVIHCSNEQIDVDKSRKSKEETYIENVLKEGKEYRFPFKKLSMRERVRRVNCLVYKTLAACIDKREFKKEKMDYLRENTDLAVDLLTVIDMMKDKLQHILNINLMTISQDYVTPPPPSSMSKPTFHSTAVSLLCEATETGYERLRASIAEDFKVDRKSIPSFYMVTKDRPNITDFCIEPKVDVEEEMNDIGITIDSTVDLLEEKILPLRSVKSMCGKNLSIEEGEKVLMLLDKEKHIEGARIEGQYDDWINYLVTKHEDHGRKLEGDVIVMDSYDGAEHMTLQKKKAGVVSFSTQAFNAYTIKEGNSVASSHDILTWQQYRGEENAENVFAATKTVYERKKYLRKNGLEKLQNCNISYYDLHDGKMLYLLTQHSLFNRKHQPFLLCTCQRGEGIDCNHICKLIDHDEQIRLWDRSKRRWLLKKGGVDSEKYQVKHHRDWVDVKNSGVSHLGLHPDELRRDSIRFDVFHLRCSITRRIMSYLRKYIMKQTTEVMEEFSEMILKFWSEYNVMIWNLNKGFSSFIGRELLLFVENIPKIVDFLKKTFVETDHVKDICKGLILLSEITPFLVITQISDNIDEYKNQFERFNNNVKDFYEVGSRTFLTKRECGDDEIFYMHCLRFYLPHIAADTLKKHKLGLGIYTMQGYERRNKESKNVLKRFSNMRNNFLINNLKRLWDVFKWGKNAV